VAKPRGVVETEKRGMGDTGMRRKRIALERYSNVNERAWRWTLAGAGVGRSVRIYAFRMSLFGVNLGDSPPRRGGRGANSWEPQINMDGHSGCAGPLLLGARRRGSGAWASGSIRWRRQRRPGLVREVVLPSHDFLAALGLKLSSSVAGDRAAVSGGRFVLVESPGVAVEGDFGGLAVRRSYSQLSTECRQLSAGGFLFPAFHAIPIIAWVGAIGQDFNDIDDSEVPLVLVPDASDLLAAKNNDLAL